MRNYREWSISVDQFLSGYATPSTSVRNFRGLSSAHALQNDLGLWFDLISTLFSVFLIRKWFHCGVVPSIEPPISRLTSCRSRNCSQNHRGTICGTRLWKYMHYFLLFNGQPLYTSALISLKGWYWDFSWQHPCSCNQFAEESWKMTKLTNSNSCSNTYP